MIKAVFFDLDGTLCDSDTAWNKAVKDTFQLFHKFIPSISENELKTAWNTVHQQLFYRLDAGMCSMAEVRDSRFPCLLERLNVQTSKYVEELNEYLSTCYIKNLRLYDDVTVLEDLCLYHVGIITNGASDEHTDSQLSKVKHLGLLERIQSLTISDEIGVRKPNPKIFKTACDRADVLPSEAIMVGDSVGNDVVGANSVNMTSILIDRNSDVAETDIEIEQPNYSISDLYEILTYLTIR